MKQLSPITALAICLASATAIAANMPDFKTLDANGDHAVSSAEWLQGGMPLQKFQALDRNKDGSLTMDEMESAQGTSPSPNTKTSGPGEPGAVVPPDSDHGKSVK